MIEPDGSSWHLTKDAARAFKNYVRRLYTRAYHSWSEIPNSIRQTMFNEFKNEFHRYVAENVNSLVEMTPELSTQIWKEKVVGGTHKGRFYGLGSQNDSEWRRVAEQRSMTETIQQIKEQVMNLAHRPTTSAPEDTDDDSDDEDDYVVPTP
ncbi:hypothetical protein MTR67_000778 [Solanum verrucosum]|uniref:Transposase n=1 Tax=Solanum verrucosum TaxID=315347 RepID=A0AAF0PM04_SOLVR|nr:hypothetical protein MTR67_000778 [Solanum verrucosum]